MKLKKCPFCGGEAHLIQNYNDRLGIYFIYVECGVCKSRGKTSSAAVFNENESCLRSVDAWNKRTHNCYLESWGNSWILDRGL